MCQQRPGLIRLHRGRDRGGLDWVAPCSDYVADFERAARRVLSADLWAVFKRHFVEDRSLPECLPLLRADGFRYDRGEFCHAVYRIERLVALAAVSGGAYALYPPKKYFGAGQFIDVEQIGRSHRRPRLKDYDKKASPLVSYQYAPTLHFSEVGGRCT